MRKYFWLSALSLFFFVCFFFFRGGYGNIMVRLFSISGTVSVPGMDEGLVKAEGSSARLKKGVANTNRVLILSAQNEQGMIIAVKKIINPKFPYKFNINRENLIMPDLVTRRVSLSAHLSSHGQMGRVDSKDYVTGPLPLMLLWRKDISLTLRRAGN